MRRSLTIVLALHWSALFAVLAAIAGLDASGGARGVAAFLGAGAGLAPDPSGSAGLSVAFAVTSALFLWLLATAVGDDASARQTRDVARTAVVSGVLVVGLLSITVALEPVPGAYASLAAMLAALLVSYLAIGAHVSDVAAEDGRIAARAMAVQAAHRAMLPRLTGRPVEGSHQ